MSLLTPTWHKLAGAAKWITCRKLRGPKPWHRLHTCLHCDKSQLRAAFGILWLSCGEPGEEGEDGTCGCVLAISNREDAKRVTSIEDPMERRRVGLTVLHPKAKTRCQSSECPLGKW